jgi:hypothetical protein
MDGNTMENSQVTDTNETQTTENQAAVETKYYTQEEFDRHMSGMRKSIEAKFEKQFHELGDLNELKQLKVNAEKAKTEEALKKGEFEKVLQEMAAKKDAEIQKRDQVIKSYKINSPLIDSASRYRAVAPEQVRSLLNDQVRLNDTGDVEVVDNTGTVRYSDSGTPLGVDDLVKEFLEKNPHFVSPAPSTTNTKNATGNYSQGAFDVSKLDMKNPAHRERFRQAKAEGLL